MTAAHSLLWGNVAAYVSLLLIVSSHAPLDGSLRSTVSWSGWQAAGFSRGRCCTSLDGEGTSYFYLAANTTKITYPGGRCPWCAPHRGLADVDGDVEQSAQRQRGARSDVSTFGPVEEFHHEKRAAAILTDVVDGDVRMGERRGALASRRNVPGISDGPTSLQARISARRNARAECLRP